MAKLRNLCGSALPCSGLVALHLCITLLVFSRALMALDRDGSARSVLFQDAASILALSSGQASKGELAHVRGVVTSPGGAGLIIQDHTAGIWVNFAQAGEFVSGDLVEIWGTVGPGGYSPEIWAKSISKLGRAPLPSPREVTFKELSSGDEDAQYISVVGVIRSIQFPRSDIRFPRIWLKLAMKDGIVDVTLPRTATVLTSRLLDAEVRLHAVALCAKNRNRQVTSVVLGLNSVNDITELSPPVKDPFEAPLVPLGSLMRYRSGTDYYHRVRIAGVVTYYDPGKRLIMQDGDQAILVMSPPTQEIRPGDRVEVSGFPAPEDTGPVLQDAILRFISHGAAIPPTRAKVVDILSGADRYGLVSIEGYVVRRVEQPSAVELFVQSDSNLIQAEIPGSAAQQVLGKLQEGTKVLLTGINLVDVEGKWGYAESRVQTRILLRSVEDLRIVQLPSWWTTQHVLYLSSALAILIFVLLGLVIYNQVARWKLQVVMQERERMAHEIHDTMAQSFAGIGFQLQAIMREIPDSMSQLKEGVSHARDLVRHSHREARRSFAVNEAEYDHEIDLLPSLVSCADQMVAGRGVAIEPTVAGTPRSVSQHISNQLLRIGKEAIANAVRHADPAHLDISITYAPESVKLEIRDDGIGFIKSGNLLGFGLRGIRRRAADISAQLEIESEPGRGTRIVVVAPLKPIRRWLTWLKNPLRNARSFSYRQ